MDTGDCSSNHDLRLVAIATDLVAFMDRIVAFTTNLVAFIELIVVFKTDLVAKRDILENYE